LNKVLNLNTRDSEAKKDRAEKNLVFMAGQRQTGKTTLGRLISDWDHFFAIRWANVFRTDSLFGIFLVRKRGLGVQIFIPKRNQSGTAQMFFLISSRVRPG
jgi:hypothetical protein